MISTHELGLGFGGQKLFDDVNIRFTPGNCYGLIGANGSGKSTFLRLLSGDLEADNGVVNISSGERLSILKQDHFQYDENSVLETVLLGNEELCRLGKEKDDLYDKEEFDEEDGIKAAELEEKFGEMGGWEAESEAATILAGLDVGKEYLETKMKELKGPEKVKVLLAQALLGNPDVLLLDEPTNHLDIKAIIWLEFFLLRFSNTVIVVSHDRHFLNKVCTHIADIDFGKITAYTGNYAFWRKSSELAQTLRANQKKKDEEKAKELKAFIQRFSANASKSKQATSRKNQLEKLELSDLPVSSRRYPFVHFDQDREAGKSILTVDGVCKTIEGKKVLDNVSFTLAKGDKVVFLCRNSVAIKALFEILVGEQTADAGTFKWGVTTSQSYLPNDNSSYFDSVDMTLLDWLRQYSKDHYESFLRTFLGKMLFSGDDVLKNTKVLSGGERMRCMYSRMMLSGANVLLLDSPISHLDLEGITAVNDGLIRYKGTILFTAHDHQFIQTVANRIIDLDTDTSSENYTTFDEYIGLS